MLAASARVSSIENRASYHALISALPGKITADDFVTLPCIVRRRVQRRAVAFCEIRAFPAERRRLMSSHRKLSVRHPEDQIRRNNETRRPLRHIAAVQMPMRKRRYSPATRHKQLRLIRNDDAKKPS